MLELIVVRSKMNVFAFAFLFLSLGFSTAWSADAVVTPPAAPTAPPEAAKKRISIKFDNELIEGSIQNPSMDYMFVRKEANYKKMMRLRENFLPEVKKGKRDFSGSR